MFNQSPMVGPGSGSLTTHSVEILIMLLGAFALGFFLARALAAKARARQAGQASTREAVNTNSFLAPLPREAAESPVVARDVSVDAPITPARVLEPSPPNIVTPAAAKVESAPTRLADEITPPPITPPAAPLSADAPPIVAADDLKRINGIGPKIEEILNAAGIRSFDDLARAEASALCDVLTMHNVRLRTTDTSTWPTQAALASKGAWGELNLIQKKPLKKKPR